MSTNSQKVRIVITGMGTISPLGLNLEETWSALLAGKSGVGRITRFDVSQYDTKFAAEVKGFDPLNYMDRKLSQRMDRFTQYAVAATDMALRDAGFNSDFAGIDRDRVGVIFGSGIGGMETYHKQQQTLYESGGPHRISPFFVPMMIADIAAGYIAMRYQFKGPNYSTTSACATSANSIADALMLIQRGDIDFAVTGGSEAAVCPMGIGGFNAMKALSTRNDEPEKASRPFDAKRDGFVLGEGGAVMILEDLGHALRRGAKIHAELAGIGLTADAYHITQPAPGGEGALRSMRLAIRDAGLRPEDVDYINAHGTSTPYNDKAETEAIKAVFGVHAYKLHISSTKSMTAHLLGAAGAIEAIITALAIKNDELPPTINYEFPDPECDLNYVPNKSIKKEVNVALSNAFGFGGHNVSLLFKKFSQN